MTTRFVCNNNFPSCCPGVPCYPTITLAIAASSSGDTIFVSAGTYPECVIVNVANLTINGAQFNVDARTRNNPSGAQILNNIVQNNVQGIYLNSISTGITSQTLVFQNQIQNNTVSGPASGIGIYTDQGLSNALIDNNNFAGHTNASIDLGPTFVGTIHDVTISNNVAVMDAGFLFVNTTNLLITGNVLSASIFQNIDFGGGNVDITVTDNCIIGAQLEGIRVDSIFTTFRIAGRAVFQAAIPNENITITGNNISCNGTNLTQLVGLRVLPGSYVTPPELNATGNFWGPANGGAPTPPNNIVDAPPDTVDSSSPLPVSPRICPLTVCDCFPICPSPITVIATSTSGAIVNYSTPTQTCGDPVICSPASGSLFPVGTTTVTCTNAFGNTCSFQIQVISLKPRIMFALPCGCHGRCHHHKKYC